MPRKNKFLKSARRFASKTGKRFGKFQKTLNKKSSRFGAKVSSKFQKSTKRYLKSVQASLDRRDQRNFKYGSATVVKKGGLIYENKYSPQAYALTVWKRNLFGRASLRGAALQEAVEKESLNRINSVNFLRAGWLPAVAVFARSIHPPKQIGSNAKKFLARFGMKKSWGEGRAAKEGWTPRAYLANMAFSRHTSTDNGIKFAEEGLQKAVDQEVAEWKAHLEKSIQRATDKIVGRVLR